MSQPLSPAERTLLYTSVADFLLNIPLLSLGFLSGSASPSSEAVRGILLWSIDLFSLGMLMLVNRRRFSQFEFGVEKIQIAVQVVIALGMCVSIVFIGSRIWSGLTGDAHPPNYLICTFFTVASYVNMWVNIIALRKILQADRGKPSLILRGQIKNRTVMLVSSVMATLCTGLVIIPDPQVFRYVDSIGAIIVLGVIVYTMVQMMRSSIMTLLDAPIEEREKLLVFREIAERFDHWSSIAFVRTRRLGYSRYIEIGLSFDDTTPMPVALQTCRAIEDAILGHLEHAFVAVYPVAEQRQATAPA